jgi:hypothetical protein
MRLLRGARYLEEAVYMDDARIWAVIALGVFAVDIALVVILLVTYTLT